ncbi:MAG: hypothetical protein CMK92_05720 [Pseudomonas sp.]|nr:hypothetical protein [Pseudomonas sp.]
MENTTFITEDKVWKNALITVVKKLGRYRLYQWCIRNNVIPTDSSDGIYKFAFEVFGNACRLHQVGDIIKFIKNEIEILTFGFSGDFPSELRWKMVVSKICENLIGEVADVIELIHKHYVDLSDHFPMMAKWSCFSFNVDLLKWLVSQPSFEVDEKSFIYETPDITKVQQTAWQFYDW